jgi:8-oxo-dGTP pyrophosphatase MutT (NUDIX family)
VSELDSVDAVYRKVLAQVGGSGVGQPATPSPAVAVALWRRLAPDRREVDLAQRSPKPVFLGGYWTFPGGRIEPGDADRAAAAARELAEETGLALERELAFAIAAGRWVTPELLPSVSRRATCWSRSAAMRHRTRREAATS